MLLKVSCTQGGFAQKRSQLQRQNTAHGATVLRENNVVFDIQLFV